MHDSVTAILFLVCVSVLNTVNAWRSADNDRPGLFVLSVVGVAVASISVGVQLVRLGVVS